MYTSRPKSIIRIFCCRLINSNLDRVLFYCNSISLFYCDVIINSIFRANQEKNHPILLSSYSAPLCLALRNKQSAYADCLEIKSKTSTFETFIYEIYNRVRIPLCCLPKETNARVLPNSKISL